LELGIFEGLGYIYLGIYLAGIIIVRKKSDFNGAPQELRMFYICNTIAYG